MLSSVEIITTPTSDTPGTALLLSFQDRRYIIGGIHEGLTRAAIQRGVKLVKVQDIFITGRTEWKAIGGLLGIVMGIADSHASSAASTTAHLQANEMAEKTEYSKAQHEKILTQAFLRQLRAECNGEASRILSATPSLTIHGGPNITHSLATARRFLLRKGMPLRVEEFPDAKPKRESDCEWKPDWLDERVRVWKMAIAPAANSERQAFPNLQSPPKRRYEDFVEETSNASERIDTTPYQTSTASSADASAEDQRLRHTVVSHMFNSAWHRDQFDEVPLAEVQMPAHLFTRDPITQKIEPYRGPFPDGTNPLPRVHVLVRKPWPGALIQQLPHTKPSPIAMSYIFRTHTQRGRFQPEKAKALKVPAGPLWRELTEGGSVQSVDGQTVTPDMVLLDAREGSGFAVIDLPSHEYVHNLLERPEWKAPAVMNGVAMIVWILGPGVGENQELQTFMSHYSNFMHVISSPDSCPNIISFDSGASGAIRLNQVNPLNYPVPVHDNIPLVHLGQPDRGQASEIELIQAKRGMKLALTPSVSFQKDHFIPPLNTAEVLRNTPADVLELALAARETIQSPSGQEEISRQNLPSPDAEIIFLGTGSAQPSKYRNVSSTLLRVPGSGSYLLDCGENTLGQLKRIYRPEALCELLRDLKLIWISHLHADHHLGVLSVIKAWYDEVHGPKAGKSQDSGILQLNQGADSASGGPFEDSLVLVGSNGMQDFLGEYSEVEEFGFRHLTRLCSNGADQNRAYSILHHHDQELPPEQM